MDPLNIKGKEVYFLFYFKKFYTATSYDQISQHRFRDSGIISKLHMLNIKLICLCIVLSERLITLIKEILMVESDTRLQ